MSKIIALVDGSTYSESVCDYAAWVATRKGSSVEVLHVLGRREGVQSNLSGNIGLGARSKLMEELAELDMAKAKLAQKRGRAILEDAEARLRADGVETVTTRLRHGDLVEEATAAEEGADLIVIGKRGEGADFAKGHLGSNLERVVRASRIPVLVASRAFKPVERFLIAYDGSPAAMRAVDHIARSDVFGGLEACLLTVGEEEAKARRALEGAEAMLKGAGYAVSSQIARGNPKTVIAEQVKAQGADLLMMGAYSASRLRSLIIGSTTSEMIRGCQVPILLFR
ncbi:Universal stress protein family protein [Pseudoruegeria aquimaris]|uniref:Universal stress protein family protein n=1 Tax=Pseudoruegeria aquimaris TaxID=393663 RepID=A0A1Y5RYQ8_9RHOB|nr:universal stress protein [Pseudoruegeria aquimaris]SLN28455.1 Universal stress protein family protein [Pseudoruegeria aquimaris]